jgi:DNA-binding cell septation regulator SpoVG
MPSTKNKEGEYNDLVFPINNEARKYMADTILKEYAKNEGSSNIF